MMANGELRHGLSQLNYLKQLAADKGRVQGTVQVDVECPICKEHLDNVVRALFLSLFILLLNYCLF